MRKVAVLTGSRGDISVYNSVLDAIDKRKGLEYELIVTGMHLSKKFGHTIDEIKKSGRRIAAIVPMLKYPDTLAGMVMNTGAALIGIAKAIEKLKPDVILVLGDRGEQLAAAMAGAHMNIPVAHLHAGEVSGTIDESIRHAISKFAHLHLVATKKSRERLIRMGECCQNIYLVGAPGVDAVKKIPKISRKKICGYFGFMPQKRIILVVQHPVTSEYNLSRKNMHTVIKALLALNEQAVWVYPNSDAGHTKMMRMLKHLISKNKKQGLIKICESLPHSLYINLMRQAAVMIGNSSSGIIEAPSCGIPYVLVGTRQAGREKAKSIIEADYEAQAIKRQAKRAMSDKKFRRIIRTCVKPYDPFKDAASGRRAAEVLAAFKINGKLLQKRISY